MNTTESNRAIVTRVMEGFAKADPTPFREVMTDDFTWHTMAAGEGIWLKTVKGRSAVKAYFAALHQQFVTPQKIIPERIFADGDTVIVEAVGGGATTKRGQLYVASYCLIFGLKDGRLNEIREYFDTAYANAHLDPLRVPD